MIPLHLAREASRLGSDRDLRRSAARGALVRIATGVYADTLQWQALDADGRYRTRVRAAALISDEMAQFSHDSAAALWRLPTIGPWSDEVHELVERSRGGTSRVGIRRHGQGRDRSPERVDGVLVTGLARTVIDVATRSTFVRGVAMADAALRSGSVDRDLLLEKIASLGALRGIARARSVVDFADGRAESPGESLARVQFHALGYPRPELQVTFSDDRGRAGTVDFYWPDRDLIVEFDGRSKYGDARRFRPGLSPAEVVVEEKLREDRLRDVVRSFARIDWATSLNRDLLADRLSRHGLHARRRP